MGEFAQTDRMLSWGRLMSLLQNSNSPQAEAWGHSRENESVPTLTTDLMTNFRKWCPNLKFFGVP